MITLVNLFFVIVTVTATAIVVVIIFVYSHFLLLLIFVFGKKTGHLLLFHPFIGKKILKYMLYSLYIFVYIYSSDAEWIAARDLSSHPKNNIF